MANIPCPKKSHCKHIQLNCWGPAEGWVNNEYLCYKPKPNVCHTCGNESAFDECVFCTIKRENKTIDADVNEKLKALNSPWAEENKQ